MAGDWIDQRPGRPPKQALLPRKKNVASESAAGVTEHNHQQKEGMGYTYSDLTLMSTVSEFHTRHYPLHLKCSYVITQGARSRFKWFMIDLLRLGRLGNCRYNRGLNESLEDKPRSEEGICEASRQLKASSFFTSTIVLFLRCLGKILSP